MPNHTKPLLFCLTLLGILCPGFLLAQIQDPYIGGYILDSLYYADGMLSWKNDCATTPGSPSEIYRIPAAGGPLQTVFAPSGCAPSDQVRSELAFDAASQSFYYLNNLGHLNRLPLGGAPQVISTTPHPLYLNSNAQVVVAGNHVLWAEAEGELLQNFLIYQSSKTGSAAQLIYTGVGLSFLQQIMAADGTNFFLLTDSGTIVQLVQTFNAYQEPYWYEVVFDPPGRATAIAVRDGRLYWAEKAPDNLSTALRSAPVINLSATTLHYTITGFGESHRINELVVDAQHFYYQVTAMGISSLHKVPLGGGASVELSGALNYTATYLVSDGLYLYWRKNQSNICRLPINSAAVTRDIEVTGLEVVQVIQSPDNYAPLIMGKPTMVRFFGRLAASSDGRTEITLAPDALLYATKNGQPLPGSPLSPEPPAPGQRRAIYSTPPNRLNINDGWLFQLPDSWTRMGVISLTGKINPRRVVTETSYENNDRTATVDFERRAPIVLSIVPLRHRLGTLGDSWNPGLEPMWERAESILPTTELVVHFQVGSPMEEIEATIMPPFFRYGPYELTKDDDEGWYILNKLLLRNILSVSSALLSEEFRGAVRYHTVALFPTSHDQAFNGLANFNSVICYVDLANRTGDFNDINKPPSGITLAHELGHNYGRCHVVCPTEGEYMPAWDDGCRDWDYPNPACDISSPGLFIGFDPLSRTIIGHDEAGDLMSYAHTLTPAKNRWPSAYTWTGIKNALRLMPASPSPRMLAPPSEPQGPDDRYWLISGYLDPTTG